ncbi:MULTISPECIES: hypothetical protein [Pseudoalteromonas]|uniref:Uncharacterized protein n=1 Tax=Pseudoalteromonas luteoviolacea (strain 2ta16) TaxID=1353533 RepID=V4HWW5_PSEL2|nr:MULTISPECIES: hypothetical protein [Pseudoalteromonas]ESP92444.1 hypothetical protein PL2TA16_04252 [Pseudoalteromonas luteoviolacea 2ta16]KZN35004.1 hypothetical protein N483_23975 [Pseudoalteromonas luteoviolacea NCIMB 1944]MCG7550700.1 hypothetical protein [Pseudoalteromonas sp. Of7M-16]
MSWICGNCQMEIEDDTFEVCWNCSCVKGESQSNNEEYTPVDCIRCAIPLTFIGTKEFHEGMRWGLLGNLAEFFINKEQLDMFACKRCGKVEFFLAGKQRH